MIKISWIVVYILFSFNLQAQEISGFFHDQFPGMWQRARAYTLEVAEAMPEDEYGFKPTEEQMEFRKQMTHIAGNIYWLSKTFIVEDKSKVESKNFDVISKPEIINLLNDAFTLVDDIARDIDRERLDEQIEFAGEIMTRERIFYLMRDHNTHHRAQAITYLRLQSIKPPNYRGW